MPSQFLKFYGLENGPCFSQALAWGFYDIAKQIIDENKNNVINKKDKFFLFYQTVPIHLTTNFLDINTDVSFYDRVFFDELAMLLIKKKALLTIRFNGRLPIHNVAAREHANLEVFKLLIEFGSKYNVKDDNGLMPLHYALIYKNDGICDHLLGLPSIQLDKSILDYAKQYNPRYVKIIRNLSHERKQERKQHAQSRLNEP